MAPRTACATSSKTPRAINAVCKVLRQDQSDRTTRSYAAKFLLHLAEMPTARQGLAEAHAVEALLLTGVRHEELFGSAAAALAYFPSELVSEKVELSELPCGIVSIFWRRPPAAESQCWATVLPLADLILDVLNFVDFVKRQYLIWMACLLCGLVFNGIASAILQQARPGRAMLNMFTLGTLGQMAEGVDTQRA